MIDHILIQRNQTISQHLTRTITIAISISIASFIIHMFSFYENKLNKLPIQFACKSCKVVDLNFSTRFVHSGKMYGCVFLNEKKSVFKPTNNWYLLEKCAQMPFKMMMSGKIDKLSLGSASFRWNRALMYMCTTRKAIFFPYSCRIYIIKTPSPFLCVFLLHTEPNKNISIRAEHYRLYCTGIQQNVLLAVHNAVQCFMGFVERLAFFRYSLARVLCLLSLCSMFKNWNQETGLPCLVCLTLRFISSLCRFFPHHKLWTCRWLLLKAYDKFWFILFNYEPIARHTYVSVYENVR